MSPEYAIDGLFSLKSDVFSFGVLVLEIVSGKKNRGFYHPDHDYNLLGHVSLEQKTFLLQIVKPFIFCISIFCFLYLIEFLSWNFSRHGSYGMKAGSWN
jgi:hypothetical protein